MPHEEVKPPHPGLIHAVARAEHSSVEHFAQSSTSVIMERVMGIEPTSKAWEAFVLPLNYTRLCRP